MVFDFSGSPGSNNQTKYQCCSKRKFDCEAVFTILDAITWTFGEKELYRYDNGRESYPSGKTKYSVRRSGQHFILDIKDLTLEDGGTYKCSSPGFQNTSHLLVLG